ncbi:MAG: Ig-like domain-containing protein, partial [Saprospiraceae bacterium]|nr:Ig-like domain-containing protein [Saprospiraceae bacterium]
MKVTYRFLILLSFFATIISCKKSFDSTSFTQEEIGRYIAARVPAVIEPEDPVRIRFSVPVDTAHTDAILSFNPDTKGNAYWEDELTLAFAPEDRWQPGKDYQVQVNLDKA